MPNTYKILGQSIPTANTFFDIYAVPSGANAIVSTVNVCNTTSSNVTFRLAAKIANTTLTTRQYLVFDTPLPAQDSIALSLGLSLGAGDVLTAFSLQGNVTFNVFGVEIT
jgi:hypothetical protein